MLIAFYLIIGCAIIAMLIGLGMALRLKKLASGGIIGRVVHVILGLIILFTLGYCAAPFLPRLPPTIGLIFVAGIFLFGALYVILVLRLITQLVQQVIEVLELEN